MHILRALYEASQHFFWSEIRNSSTWREPVTQLKPRSTNTAAVLFHQCLLHHRMDCLWVFSAPAPGLSSQANMDTASFHALKYSQTYAAFVMEMSSRDVAAFSFHCMANRGPPWRSGGQVGAIVIGRLQGEVLRMCELGSSV